MSSHPETTIGKDFVFRLAFLDDFQGNALGRFAANELGARRAAVLYDETNQYSAGLANRFHDAFVSAGGEIVARESFTTDVQETFVDQLRRIAAASPEVIFLPNQARADSIQIVEARALGIDAVFLGGDSWDLQRLRRVPEADGSFVVHHWHYEAPEPETAAFIDAFEAKYNAMPRTTAAMTYDAVQLVVQAIARAEATDGTAVRREIAATNAFKGVTGTISFRGSGDPLRSAVVSTLQAGEINVRSVIDP